MFVGELIILKALMKFILGRKLGMTTIYDEKKGALNVTLIECEPNAVSLIRTAEKDGYGAAQISIKKNKKGNYKKEFRVSDKNELKTGDTVTIEGFQPGDKVKISGTSKAKGFQGVMKRHGFKGAPHSHGHKHDWRAPGSIGSQAPQRVIKGMRMAGRMGGRRSTVSNLEIVYLNTEKNIIGVKGAAPGVTGRIVEIVKS